MNQYVSRPRQVHHIARPFISPRLPTAVVSQSAALIHYMFLSCHTRFLPFLHHQVELDSASVNSFR